MRQYNIKVTREVLQIRHIENLLYNISNKMLYEMTKIELISKRFYRLNKKFMICHNFEVTYSVRTDEDGIKKKTTSRSIFSAWNLHIMGRNNLVDSSFAWPIMIYNTMTTIISHSINLLFIQKQFEPWEITWTPNNK